MVPAVVRRAPRPVLIAGPAASRCHSVTPSSQRDACVGGGRRYNVPPGVPGSLRSVRAQRQRTSTAANEGETRGAVLRPRDFLTRQITHPPVLRHVI
jgi:hypothetical protein